MSARMLLNAELAFGHSMLISALILLFALWMDRLLGEPAKFHPLVGFGWLVSKIEISARKLNYLTVRQQGIVAWVMAVIPVTLTTVALLVLVAQLSLALYMVLSTVFVYLTLGGRSLIEHADNIYKPLQAKDITSARSQVSLIVSRNTEDMSEQNITSSTIESVLENGNDAVFAPMFWFIVLGAPGAVLFRLANTLDAMWGYKTEQYLNFGRFTAKTDDILGWIPARLTATIYAFQGHFYKATTCWRTQAKQCSSPNGGVVMTAGAGALNVMIGGPTYYHGVLHDKKPMGCGEIATWHVIPKANQLISKGSFALSYVLVVTAIVGV